AYFNQAHRWTWGVLGGQIPYVATTLQTAIGTSASGEPLALDRQIVYRETQRGATGVVAYPFDRARRVEFQGGFAQTSFEQIVSLTAYSMATRAVVSDTTSTIEAARRLNLATTSVALVFDTASFGATSPIQGQRYRLELTPTFGS